jgi:hypothetical protein
MDYLQKSILKTVAYWDVLDWPLTAFEIWRYLINPRRLGLHAPDHPTLGEILEALSSKELSKYLASTSGFWHFRDRSEELVKQRIQRELLADMNWKIVKRRAKWLQIIPFIRLVMGSGSLSAGNMTEKSDFDLLIITKAGRIWTTRALVTLFLDILGWRRRDEINTAGKFCLNHYITDRSLTINMPSIYTAQSYAHLLPIWGDMELYRSFQERNAWLKIYLANYPQPFLPHVKSIAPKKILSSVARLFEKILSGRLGDKLEMWLGAYQAKKIAANPKTGTSGGRVVFSSEVLEFHPNSKERWIISRLNERLTALGFPELADEKDSGLTP